MPAVYHTLLSGDLRRDHPYFWFYRAILCLNHLKIPTRRNVEDAWRAIGEGKARLQPNLSSGERKEFVRNWLEPIPSARSYSYWLAIDKYMTHKNLDLAPSPISHLMVGVTSNNNTPYSLALQHDFAPEVNEATKTIKAKTIQPLPVIPLTMTDDDLYPHFCKNLAALQPSGIIITDDDAKGIWNYLMRQRQDRLKKIKP
ncbi:hypothetical protein MMC14_003770 [Varicellaria rhodocarpa]|nr:hypothetical protein [Varicellaria rhodocarpa]